MPDEARRPHPLFKTEKQLALSIFIHKNVYTVNRASDTWTIWLVPSKKNLTPTRTPAITATLISTHVIATMIACFRDFFAFSSLLPSDPACGIALHTAATSLNPDSLSQLLLCSRSKFRIKSNKY